MKDSKGGQYGFAVLPSSTGELLLEMESDLSRKRTRRYVVRSAERGKEVVESVLVGYVDRRKLETHLVLVSAEDVVMSDGNVEETSRPRSGVGSCRRSRYSASAPAEATTRTARRDKPVRGCRAHRLLRSA